LDAVEGGAKQSFIDIAVSRGTITPANEILARHVQLPRLPWRK